MSNPPVPARPVLNNTSGIVQPPPNGFESAKVKRVISSLHSNGDASYTSIVPPKGQATTPTNNNNTMPGQILAETARAYGLDPEEAHLGLMAIAAGKEVAQRAATATEDELRRLRDMRRLCDLRLDLYQKLNAAAGLPDELKTREQYRAAGSLVKTQNDLRQLEEKLFGANQVSEKKLGAREAKRRMTEFERSKPNLAA